MKLRTGFVSNSSSSSFVFSYKNEITKETLLEMIKKVGLTFQEFSFSDRYVEYTAEEITDSMFNSFDEISDDIIEEMISFVNDDDIKIIGYNVLLEDLVYEDISDEQFERMIAKTVSYFRLFRKLGEDLIDEDIEEVCRYIAKMKEKGYNKFYTTTFADESGGIWSELEHGKAKTHTEFLQINNH